MYIQWFSVFPHSCTTIIITYFQNIFLIPQGNSAHPLSTHSFLPAPSPWQPPIYLCLRGFALSGHCMWAESFLWPFVSEALPLRVMALRFAHVGACWYFISFYCRVIFHRMGTSRCVIRSLVDGHLSCFHCLATVNESK